MAGRPAEVAWVLDSVVRWAAARPDVLAVGLAGSQARGEARPDSDVDLGLLTDAPEAYLGGSWAPEALGHAVDVRTRWWGPLLERRFRLAGGLEVECGFAPPAWAALPVDAGTSRVVADGFVVLQDPSGLLGQLVRAVARES
jgi:uncharacterized protein